MSILDQYKIYRELEIVNGYFALFPEEHYKEDFDSLDCVELGNKLVNLYEYLIRCSDRESAYFSISAIADIFVSSEYSDAVDFNEDVMDQVLAIYIKPDTLRSSNYVDASSIFEKREYKIRLKEFTDLLSHLGMGLGTSLSFENIVNKIANKEEANLVIKSIPPQQKKLIL